MREACFERKVPGEGELPLADFVAAQSADVLVEVEVPILSEVESGGDLREIIGRSVAAAQRLLEAF